MLGASTTVCKVVAAWLVLVQLQLAAGAFVDGPSALIGASNRAAVVPAASAVAMSNADATSQNDTVGQMLGGLVFLKTADRAATVDFYTDRLGMSVWLEQPNITILKHGNMILGFHQIQPDSEDAPDLQGIFADGAPRHNERYRIYQFFAQDPEGRNLEFQAFLHPLSELSSRPMSN